MFKAIKEFFFGKPAESKPAAVAPYKIETPPAAVEQAPAAKPAKKPTVKAKTTAAKKPRANKQK